MIAQNKKIKTENVANIGLMVALIEAAKFAFLGLPNIELISFFIIVFSVYFGKKVFFAIPAFILVEGAVFGFGIWWFMYLYTWPLLAVISLIFSKVRSVYVYASISALFGFSFGLLCSLSYVFIWDIGQIFAWWIAGIPWDIIHGVSNFIIMLVLYKPVMKILKKAEEKR